MFTFVALVISALVSSSFAMSSLFLVNILSSFVKGAEQYIFLKYISVFAIFGNPNSPKTLFLLVTKHSKANPLTTGDTVTGRAGHVH